LHYSLQVLATFITKSAFFLHGRRKLFPSQPTYDSHTGLEAKKLFEYHKRITSDLLKAVLIFNRERDVVTLDFFLTNLVAA
jgi:hypothetical protein